MAHPYHHALSSARKSGGTAEDYLPLHQRFDESKAITADFRHRALRHHREAIPRRDVGEADRAEGVFMLERFFGATITIGTGRVVPVRLIGEQHVREDLGFVPGFADWVRCIRPEPWMGRAHLPASLPSVPPTEPCWPTPIHRELDPFAIPPAAYAICLSPRQDTRGRP